VSDSRARLHFFLDLPGTTQPEFTSLLVQHFTGFVERDYGLASPLTSELVKRHLRAQTFPVGFREELPTHGTGLVLTRRPLARYRAIASADRWIVFVRDPVERVVAHWKVTADAGKFTGTLLEFASAPENRNLQVRLLRGFPWRQLAFVGWSEHLPYSYERLRELPGFAELPIELQDGEGVAPPSEAITEAERAQVADWNADDLAFVARGRSLRVGLPPKLAVPPPKAKRKPAQSKPMPARRQKARAIARLHSGPYAKHPWPLLSTERRLALLFSAKAGCTFATKWFFEHVGLAKEAAAHSPWIHNYRQEVHYTGASYRPDDIANPDMRIVKFVRNPFERAVSSYLHASKHGYEDAALARFLGRSIRPKQRFSFREFVRYLETRDLRSCNLHHRLQIHPLEESSLVAWSHLVKIEESAARLPVIEAELGLPFSDIGRLATSGHHTRRIAHETFCGDEVFSFSDGTAEAPPSRAFYDRDIERAVAELYRPDFEAYGYPTRFHGTNG
jgi:hypothetical protein